MRSMRRMIVGIAAMLPLAALAADPYLGFVYPAAVRRGTTVRLLVGGQNLGGVRQAFVSGSGVEAIDIQPVPNFPQPDGSQRKHIRNWLDSIARGVTNEPALPPKTDVTTWRSNRWWTALNTLDAGQLDIVRRDLHTPRNALQATPSLSGQLLLTLNVARNAKPGIRFVNLVSWNGISAPRPIVVTDTPIVPEPAFRAPHEPVPPMPVVTRYPATLVGQIYPGETDAFALDLPAGARLVCSVCARELQPCIGDAVPGFFNPVVELWDAAGNEVACADDHDFNPDPVLRAKIPAAGRYILRIRDNLFRGRGDFGYVIRVSGDGSAPPPLTPFRLELPALTGLFVSSGKIARAGMKGSLSFSIPEPGTYVFETRARRLGASLDPVMTLYRGRQAEGTPLAVWDDVTNAVHVGSVLQAECDPIGSYTFESSGDFTVTVADRARATGPYTLAVRRPTPSFAVYSMRSTACLIGSAPAKIPLRIVRQDGFSGEIRLSASERLVVTPQVIPAGTNELVVGISCRGVWRQRLPFAFDLTAQAADGKPQRVIPADEYEQAFAWKHLLPAPSFVGVARPPKGKNAGKGGRKGNGR